MDRIRRQWSDRIKEIEAPLFTGNVFCRLNTEVPWAIVSTPGVSDCGNTKEDRID